jgi:superfamily I DNA/RNA helicase
MSVVVRFVKPQDWRPAGGIRLEEAASRVVTSDASMSVIAGPGSGKTELLAQRAFYLLQTGVCRPPQRILAISFKRDAAKALKDRVGRRCAPEQARRFDSYTFDAFPKGLLDRFLVLTPEWCRPQRNYRIIFPSRDDKREFMAGLRPPAALGGVEGITHEQVEAWGPLPAAAPTPDNVTAWVAAEWWRRCVTARRSELTFPMISRLAEAILRHNPDVLRALRLTYSHVFLDEFQDTTRRQYGLTLAFKRSPAILTSVGDTKQRIMKWAGAEAEVFDWFDRDFSARREMLQLNHRSNARIVQIINDLVRQIEPDAVETLCARADDPVPDDAAAFWRFDTDAEEAAFLASFIADDIEEHRDEGRCPDDFALLVRIRADQAEARLRPAFAARGLELRNEARALHGIAIQDLMADEIVCLLSGLLRLALGARGQAVYRPVQDVLASILGTDFENPRDLKRLDELIRQLIREIVDVTRTAPRDSDMADVVAAIVEALDEKAVRRAFRQYEDERYFRDLQAALAALMAEHAQTAASWAELIDGVEGRGQIKLMTIHKSKGLEYHTVIFVGLHQNAFFGFRNNREEETNAFFVALSRARERVYFTRSAQSGQVHEIKELVDLLDHADVPVVEH